MSWKKVKNLEKSLRESTPNEAKTFHLKKVFGRLVAEQSIVSYRSSAFILKKTLSFI